MIQPKSDQVLRCDLDCAISLNLTGVFVDQAFADDHIRVEKGLEVLIVAVALARKNDYQPLKGFTFFHYQITFRVSSKLEFLSHFLYLQSLKLSEKWHVELEIQLHVLNVVWGSIRFRQNCFEVNSFQVKLFVQKFLVF